MKKIRSLRLLKHFLNKDTLKVERSGKWPCLLVAEKKLLAPKIETNQFARRVSLIKLRITLLHAYSVSKILPSIVIPAAF